MSRWACRPSSHRQAGCPCGAQAKHELVSISLPPRLDQSIGKPSLFISVSGGFPQRGALGMAAPVGPFAHPSTRARLSPPSAWAVGPPKFMTGKESQRGAGDPPPQAKWLQMRFPKGCSVNARTCGSLLMAFPGHRWDPVKEGPGDWGLGAGRGDEWPAQNSSGQVGAVLYLRLLVSPRPGCGHIRTGPGRHLRLISPKFKWEPQPHPGARMAGAAGAAGIPRA